MLPLILALLRSLSYQYEGEQLDTFSIDSRVSVYFSSVCLISVRQQLRTSTSTCFHTNRHFRKNSGLQKKILFFILKVFRTLCLFSKLYFWGDGGDLHLLIWKETSTLKVHNDINHTVFCVVCNFESVIRLFWIGLIIVSRGKAISNHCNIK